MHFTELIEKVLTARLNTVNDAAAGAPLASPSGRIVQAYAGQLGKKVCLEGKEVKYDSTTGALYGGVYQYVQFKSDSSGSNARGQVVFWSDMDDYVVTPDAAAGNLGLWAGITLNAVTKGNYGWIQVAGRATVKFKSSITKATPAAGDLVIIDQAPTNTADILADATGLTSLHAKSILGTVETAPSGGGVAVVQLWPRFNNMG